ncbi:hypothetical protein HNQ80_004227 [Anaerosolibacter carboniphilus]|uniref:Spo0E like sporulation regulatory protein n=1 Tax=Anaerosolibacter carboniphilus TaxID=1417629 RepID=A0A841L0I6_9FIRM|nr:Spo0E family sporulation regulatory protein-aspartic acid phosphatase [Anaerosolibacter carboniphilus]MBB6218088.1 hypothetical protein [Anaerosolibacter carboniphilus]
MDRIAELRYQIELLREKLLSLLSHHEDLHAPELIVLSNELHDVLNEYYRLLGISN